jgi:hypothetical protein
VTFTCAAIAYSLHAASEVGRLPTFASDGGSLRWINVNTLNAVEREFVVEPDVRQGQLTEPIPPT